MTIVYQERSSDSPYIQTVTRGCTLSDGAPTRPAEINWHMVCVREKDVTRLLLVGPWSESGTVTYQAGAEVLWIRFALGTYMPHLPTKDFLNSETALPGAASASFWLKGAAWQFPDFDNAETFVAKMVHEGILERDPVVSAVMQGHTSTAAARTVRHRFLHVTGQTQKHIQQVRRAQEAAHLLERGIAIQDTIYEAGYFDQPHLTRSLKRFIGRTPAQQYVPPDACHSVQDTHIIPG